MGSDNELEKFFAESIDRMLAGNQAGADPALGDDMRTAQNFAQKIFALRCVPSPEFKVQLKARLLGRLNARPAPRPWLERMWPKRTGRQIAGAIAVLVIAIGVMWGTGLFKTAEPPYSPSPYLSISGSTDKTAYRAGEPVNIQVILKNVTSQPLDVGSFPPILSLMQGSTRQPVYTFVDKRAARSLKPEQTVTFTVSWDQRDDKGRLAPRDAYYLELEDLDYQGEALKLDFPRPVRFEVKG